jgi:rod shape determining protein RodA
MVALAEQRRRGRTLSHQGWLRVDSIDWVLWGVPLILCFVAGILIASTQRQADYADWYQHWVTAAVGMVVALLAARLPMDRLQGAQWPIYILTNLSLVAVRFVGTSALGAQRWINIAGFHVQPSEFAKVAAILLLAGLLARFPVERPVDLIRPITLISVPWALVFLQPDLGTSLVYGAILLVMLFWAGLSGSWLMLLLSPLVTAIIAGVAPWGLALWIPLMALLAWRSLPWRRIGLLVVTAVQVVFAASSGITASRTTSASAWCCSSIPPRMPSGAVITCSRARLALARAGCWAQG